MEVTRADAARRALAWAAMSRWATSRPPARRARSDRLRPSAYPEPDDTGSSCLTRNESESRRGISPPRSWLAPDPGELGSKSPDSPADTEDSDANRSAKTSERKSPPGPNRRTGERGKAMVPSQRAKDRERNRSGSSGRFPAGSSRPNPESIAAWRDSRDLSPSTAGSAPERGNAPCSPGPGRRRPAATGLFGQWYPHIDRTASETTKKYSGGVWML